MVAQQVQAIMNAATAIMSQTVATAFPLALENLNKPEVDRSDIGATFAETILRLLMMENGLMRVRCFLQEQERSMLIEMRSHELVSVEANDTGVEVTVRFVIKTDEKFRLPTELEAKKLGLVMP